MTESLIVYFYQIPEFFSVQFQGARIECVGGAVLHNRKRSLDNVKS